MNGFGDLADFPWAAAEFVQDVPGLEPPFVTDPVDARRGVPLCAPEPVPPGQMHRVSPSEWRPEPGAVLPPPSAAMGRRPASRNRANLNRWA